MTICMAQEFRISGLLIQNMNAEPVWQWAVYMEE